jgi:hypothetical protein
MRSTLLSKRDLTDNQLLSRWTGGSRTCCSAPKSEISDLQVKSSGLAFKLIGLLDMSPVIKREVSSRAKTLDLLVFGQS